MLDLLQDVHLPLDVLPAHPPPTRLAAPLLDKLGGEFGSGAPVSTSSDHGELTTETRQKNIKNRQKTFEAGEG